MTGTLEAIAIRPARKQKMVTLDQVFVDSAQGLVGDHAGKRPDRLVTMITVEGWAAACANLDPPLDPVCDLSWLTRRANLLVSGEQLPRAPGGIVQVGPVTLYVTGFTYPCSRMESAQSGLLKALAQDWRAGVLRSVIKEGHITVGDTVETLHAPAPIIRKLP